MHRIAHNALTFARLFSAWCKARGLDPAQGAVALGYSEDIGYKWVRGDSVPPRNKAPLLAREMGMTPERVRRAADRTRALRLARR